MKYAFNAAHYLIALASIFVLIVNAYASSLIPDKVHDLPTAPTRTRPVSRKYVHVKPYIAHDAEHHTVKVPAYIIDIDTGAGFWESPEPSKVPPFTFQIHKSLLGKVALYYSKEFGWVAAPRGWVIVSAGVGVDGGGNLAFVEPDISSLKQTAVHGWMTVGFSLGNLGGFGEADGIIPGAHRAMVEGWPDFQKEPPKLVPKPNTMDYPNPCTAVFSYRIPNSPIVHAVVYFGPSIEPVWRDKYMTEVFLALPESQSALANFIIKTFLSNIGECTAPKLSKA